MFLINDPRYRLKQELDKFYAVHLESGFFECGRTATEFMAH